MRRKPYIITGWLCTLFLLFILALFVNHLDASSWIGMNAAIQACLIMADVPSDGYLVELGQHEPTEKRGQVIYIYICIIIINIDKYFTLSVCIFYMLYIYCRF